MHLYVEETVIIHKKIKALQKEKKLGKLDFKERF